MLGVQLPERLEAWVEELVRRPSVAAEAEIVRAM
jgi:hypothetical protein